MCHSRRLEWGGGGALLDIKKRAGICSAYKYYTPWELAVKYRKPEMIEIMKPYKPNCGPCCMMMFRIKDHFR
ncbi:unnamed protein product [Vitrella brassicaformis CCMP3155]|uniref:Uncharacterized protein n=1 Tax=Vitrella brassicaformis (strain CCMP3155) TaxID=1169540 RepID=A0A0G4ES17_VITBC|nr:unnamed protein product [Vitrella brassicaformis CCMP3155]|eukprot:CEM00697.1 unnamed protein product [Vitrella brassicaformis CCMP3155]